MKPWRATCLSLSLMVLGASAVHADPMDDVKAVERAERDFAADTQANGFHRGFIAWSTEDAVGFLPQATNYHAGLVADLAADPTLATKPTRLRWRPFYVTVSDDLAFDLGPWTVEGGDKAGWYFTIWQKQADGGWKWSLDGGCASDTPANLPTEDTLFRGVLGNGSQSDSAAPAQGLAQDDTYNHKLATTPYAQVFEAVHGDKPTVCSDGVPPYISGYWPWPEGDGAASPPPGAEEKIAAVKAAAIAARPAPGLVWSRDGYGASKSGTFVYTYGRAVTAAGEYKGHYVRVWDRMTNDSDNWVLIVDVFHP